MMDWIDRIMEILNDSKYHDFDDIRTKISLEEYELNEVLKFLQELGIIEKKNGTFRIKQLGLKFLDLPC
jgi:predicted transcriptional regulator